MMTATHPTTPRLSLSERVQVRATPAQVEAWARAAALDAEPGADSLALWVRRNLDAAARRCLDPVGGEDKRK